MPRKTERLNNTGDHRHRASMRPRPDAAENLAGGGKQTPARSAASMRPRPDAAENRSVRVFCAVQVVGWLQ